MNLNINTNYRKLNTIEEFKNIIDNFNQKPCFVLASGEKSDMSLWIDELDKIFTEQMKNGKCFYNRVSSLPIMDRTSNTQYYIEKCKNWRAGGRQQIALNFTLGNIELEKKISEATNLILNLYKEIKTGFSETMENNYIVKLWFWLEKVMDSTLANSKVKFIADNISKEQDFLFCYMLTLLGADILILDRNCTLKVSEKILRLCQQMEIGVAGNSVISDYNYNEYLKKLSIGNVENVQPVKVVIPPRKSRNNNPLVQVKQPERNVTVAKEQLVHTGQNVRKQKSYEELAQLASKVVMIYVLDEHGEVDGSGSGIMVGRNGYILTNFHVVQNGYQYAVRIEGEEKGYVTNRLVKVNNFWDLAVIQIDKELPTLEIYKDKAPLVRGQQVVAIGSPLGLFNSISEGIISGFRVIDDCEMIQFTAPISAGSSGGAVLNMYGEVIGISTAGYGQETAQNLNLAVGHENIKKFLGNLLN